MTDESRTPEALDARFRPLIEAELVQLRALTDAAISDRSPVELDQQSIGRVSRIDSLQVQAMAQAAERRRTARRKHLHDAMARLHRNEFGWCEECGEAIAWKRLETDPAVTRCIACASGE